MVEELNNDGENLSEPPERHSRRWGLEEENEIIVELSEGKSWEEIAQNHSRTIRAVQMRFARICEHAEHLEVVRKVAPKEDSRRPPQDPKFNPPMDSGVRLPPLEKYDVINSDGSLWYSFYMP